MEVLIGPSYIFLSTAFPLENCVCMIVRVIKKTLPFKREYLFNLKSLKDDYFSKSLLNEGFIHQMALSVFNFYYLKNGIVCEKTLS